MLLSVKVGWGRKADQVRILLLHPLRNVSGSLTITLDLATTVLVYLRCHGYWANVFPLQNGIMLYSKENTSHNRHPAQESMIGHASPKAKA